MRIGSGLLAILLASVLSSGCSDGNPGVDLGVDAATSGLPDLAPVLDPHLFDCTSRGPDGKALPDRASTLPVACALDPTCRRPQVSSHRGAGGMLGVLAPEDTLAAYRAAIVVGVEFVETDPRPTADGVLVNIHDPSVDRTTSGSGAVDRMTLAELRALRVKSDGMPGDFSCEQIPTLVEVLETCRGRVVVLVDANKTDRVDLLVKAIVDANAIDWAIFDTSSLSKIDRALAIEPRLHFQIRPDTVAQITPQLDHFAPRLPIIVEIEHGDWKQGAPIIHARGTRAFSNVFVEDLAAAVSGDLSEYHRALDSGLDILQTDRPDLVVRMLKQRGLR